MRKVGHIWSTVDGRSPVIKVRLFEIRRIGWSEEDMHAANLRTAVDRGLWTNINK